MSGQLGNGPALAEYLKRGARRSRVVLLSVLGALSVAAPAVAQEGFSLNRYSPSERGSDWFVGDSLDFRGSGRLALGAVLDWSYKPLVVYDADGDELSSVVGDQLFVHVGAALNIWSRLRLAVNLPILAVNSGQGGVVDGQQLTLDEGGGIGDMHVSADLRLFGEYGDPLSLSLGGQVYLPTGAQAAFSGDGSVRVRPRLMAAGDAGVFAYAANVGVNVRTRDEDFTGVPFGNEVTFAASLGLRLADKKFLIGPEVWGSTVLKDGAAFEQLTTPLEIILSGKYKVSEDWRLGAGVGPGLTRGIGTPRLRVLASLEWFPEPEKTPSAAAPSDRDQDGIFDDQDACPERAGIESDDPERHGCPLSEDRDQDGILDGEDACPERAGVESDDAAKNGCPLPDDRDNDGIVDSEDACPDEAGISNEDLQHHGCPDPDADEDGVLLPDDACPHVQGVKDADPTKNGCPKAKIVGTKIEILERVEFDTAEAGIRPESFAVLESVLQILKRFSSIELLAIEGHTDNRGRRGFNQKLSQGRAQAVKAWLTERGIDASRLTSAGLGPDQPIDSNATEEGRQNNRRVEFTIKKGSATEKSEEIIDLDE